MSSKLISRLLCVPLIVFFGLELILWCFVRTPLEPLKTVTLSNHLPGFKEEVDLSFDRNLTRYLDGANGPRPAGTIRILCLGGSGTFAMFQNDADTWWGQLGRKLQAKGYPVQVAAWGQDRTGIVASTPMAAALMEDWQPDIVIGNFGFDDVVGQPLEYRYRPEKAAGRLSGPPRPAGWKRAILYVSQTARLARSIVRSNDAARIQDKIGRTDHWTDYIAKVKKQVGTIRPVSLPPRDPVHDPELEFMDGWKVLQEVCAENGAALIMTGEACLHDSTNNLTQQENLMTLIPVKEERAAEAPSVRPEPAWVEREMNRYADAAAAFAATAKLPWLNLNGRVPRDMQYFFSDVILTDAGAALVASELLPVVEPMVQARRK